MPKTPCAPGETRNRKTRACRLKKQPGRPAKTPCAAGQIRNRVTKKCRDKLRRGRPAKATKANKTPKSPKTYTYRVDLFEEIGGVYKRRSTERYIQIDDESNNLFGGCMDTILEAIHKVAASAIDTQAYPEDTYVTIITETPLKESLLGPMISTDLPKSCTSNPFAFKISKLDS
jgi:hypothetical protein